MRTPSSPDVRTPFEKQQDLRYQDLLNKMAELSMNLEMMKSSLREYEKQRVNSRFEEVQAVILSLIKRVEDLENNG